MRSFTIPLFVTCLLVGCGLSSPDKDAAPSSEQAARDGVGLEPPEPSSVGPAPSSLDILEDGTGAEVDGDRSDAPESPANPQEERGVAEEVDPALPDPALTQAGPAVGSSPESSEPGGDDAMEVASIEEGTPAADQGDQDNSVVDPSDDMPSSETPTTAQSGAADEVLWGDQPCDQASDSPGCAVDSVAECVCAWQGLGPEGLPECCDSAWFGYCAEGAGGEIQDCTTATDSCCEAHGTPGCDSPSVALCVCDLVDANREMLEAQGEDTSALPDCCGGYWHPTCALIAEANCEASCGGED